MIVSRTALLVATIVIANSCPLIYAQSTTEVSATAVEELQKRVVQLEARIAALEAQVKALMSGRDGGTGQTNTSQADAPDSASVPDTSIQFGSPFKSPHFQLTLIDARIARPKVKDMFGDTKQATTPGLILKMRVKNTDERKILRYRAENMFLAGYFGLRDDVDNVIRGVSPKTSE